jgi:hypothetical protein
VIEPDTVDYGLRALCRSGPLIGEAIGFADSATHVAHFHHPTHQMW